MHVFFRNRLVFGSDPSWLGSFVGFRVMDGQHMVRLSIQLDPTIKIESWLDQAIHISYSSYGLKQTLLQFVYQFPLF